MGVVVTPVPIGLLAGTSHEAFGVSPPVAWSLFGIGTVIATARWWRVRLCFDRDTVEIVNYWRTYRIPWKRVGKIEPMTQFFESPGLDLLVCFELKGDTSRGYTATATCFPGPKRERPQLIDALVEHARPYDIEVDLGLNPNGSWAAPSRDSS